MSLSRRAGWPSHVRCRSPTAVDGGSPAARALIAGMTASKNDGDRQATCILGKDNFWWSRPALSSCGCSSAQKGVTVEVAYSDFEHLQTSGGGWLSRRMSE